MTEGKLGFGIIGCGAIAEFHAYAISQSPDARLIAVCDVDLQKATSFAGSYGIDTVYGHPSDIAENPDIDIISICTPSGAHLESALPAIQRKKHILVEKPIEISTDRIDKMLNACNSNGVKLGCVFQLRFGGDFIRVKRALNNGVLGKIQMADAYLKYYRSHEYYSSAEWRGTYSLDGGGALMNQGIHYIDLLLWLVGTVDAVYAHCRTLDRKIEAEDTVYALLDYANGAVGVFEATTIAYPGYQSRIEIHGDKGTIRIEGNRVTDWTIVGANNIHSSERADEGGHSDPRAISMRGHCLQIQDMVDAVKHNHEPAVSANSARRSVALIQSIYDSSKTGHPVKISP